MTSLNAPPGYRWDDEAVVYEKRDAWLSGFIVGAVGMAFVAVVVSLLSLVALR